MHISSSSEAGALVKSLRETRGLSRKELSKNSGIPLRTVYAVENGELNNLSIDRLIALLTALEAGLDVYTIKGNGSGGEQTDRLVQQAAMGGLEQDRWGFLS